MSINWLIILTRLNFLEGSRSKILDSQQIILSVSVIIYSILASFITGAEAASLKSLKLFVLAGQSNMVGYRSNLTELPDELREPQSGVWWYNQSNDWEILAAPTEPLPSTNWLPNGVGFGPEISLGRELQAIIGEPVALVKYAANGTKLATDWNPDNPEPNSLYNSMLARVESAIAVLPPPYLTVEIAGFFWMQGEGDATEKTFADNYQANLTNFIAQVRNDFNNPNLPFVIGQISNLPPRFPYTSQVQAAQFQVSKTVPYTGIVETTTLSQHSDEVHFDSQGLIDLGYLFAEEWSSIPEPAKNVPLIIAALIVPCLSNKKINK